MAEIPHALDADLRLQAIFLDRDGTINRERADYVKNWQEYEWLPGALAALASLATLNLPILLVTNQSAVGRGLLKPDILKAIHMRVRAEVAAAGDVLTTFLFVPMHRTSNAAAASHSRAYCCRPPHNMD